MKPIDVWYVRDIQGHPQICSIDFGDDTFVAVGRGIFTSSDGITWISRQSPLKSHPYEISDVAASGRTFVAVTHDNVQGDWFPVIPLLSDDQGASWRLGPEVAWTLIPRAITSDGVVFIVVGSGDMASGIQTSTDRGSTWNVVPFTSNSPLHYFNDICVGQDMVGKRLYVAVGQGNIGGTSNYIGCFYSAASSDGVTWTEYLSGGIGEFRSVAYGNGVFVAVGSNRRFYTSKNGVTWTGRSYQPIADVFKITFANNTFVAVGAGGYVYDSQDGDKWNARNIGASETLKEIHYGKNTFLAVGENGTIYQSERYDRPLLSIQFDGYGSVEVKYDAVDVRSMRDWGATFDHGKTVTLIAHNEIYTKWVTDPFGHKIPIPSPIRAVFDHWSGAVTGKASTTTVTMDSDKTIVAHFAIWRPKPPKPPKPF